MVQSGQKLQANSYFMGPAPGLRVLVARQSVLRWVPFRGQYVPGCTIP